MRYLRMLTNALAGGLLCATYLLVLVLQLNPQVPTVSLTTLRWFGALAAFYGVYLTVVIYFILLAREALASRPLHAAWFSVRLLAWLGAAAAAVAAVLTWANINSFRAILGEVAAERMRQGAIASTASALVLLAVALLRYSFAERGSRTAAVSLVVATSLSVAVPLWLRGPGDPRVPVARAVPASLAGAVDRLVPVPHPSAPEVPGREALLPAPPARLPHIRVILLDGASLGFVRQRIAAGQLPNFGRLVEHGAVVDELATLKPTQAGPIWAAASTGKYAPKTGIRSDAVYRVEATDSDPVDLLPDYCFAYALASQGLVTQDARRTRSSLRARALWEILSDYRLVSGIVNWPFTYPARVERGYGYLISERFDDATSSPMRLQDSEAGDPTTAVDIARELFDFWQSRPWHDVLTSFRADDPRPDGFDVVRWDRAYSEAATQLDQEFGPRLTAVRYEGLEVFGHTYLRDAQPELFGESSRQGPRRSVLDRYYAFIDDEIGRAIGALEPDDLLLVVSGFGMEPETQAKRLIARRFGWLFGWPDRSGTHERAPDGFLLAYGSNVAPGEWPRGAIVDLAPTVLYYIGLPVGRDMDGVARTDLFARTFSIEHPVSYIATYEK